MSNDVNRWAQKKADVDRKMKDRQEGNLWGKLEEGEYLCYTHKPVYSKDENKLTAGFNFIEAAMHYSIGGKKNAQLCLDYENNPILSHPILQSFVANREKNKFKITPKTKCPVCMAIESGEITDQKCRQQLKWFIGLTPMWFRKEKHDKWTKLKFKPRFMIAGSQIFNGYINARIDLANDDIDPTDVDAAVLMKVTRTGTEFNTEYSVVADIGSARKPIKLDKAQRAVLEKVVKPKGELDLFMIVAGFTKSPNQVSALISGVEGSSEDEEAESKKECFGKNWADDEECHGCSDGEECMRVCGVKPKKVEAKKGKQTEKETKPEERGRQIKEPEPEPFETSMQCFGNYEPEDDACKECEEKKYCSRATSDDEQPNEQSEEEQEEQPEEEGESEYEESSDDLPNCHGSFEPTDEACVDCPDKKGCKAKTEADEDDSNSQVDDEPEAGSDDDQEVANLKDEAKRLADKARGRKK